MIINCRICCILKNNQILVSTIHDHSITQEIAIQLFEKKITAFGINYIADKNGQFLFQNIDQHSKNDFLLLFHRILLLQRNHQGLFCC